MGIPSLWAYQIIWWAAGVFLIWFLANKMDLSTLPKKPILNGDEFSAPDDIDERGNYIDKLGGGICMATYSNWLGNCYSNIICLRTMTKLHFLKIFINLAFSFIMNYYVSKNLNEEEV